MDDVTTNQLDALADLLAKITSGNQYPAEQARMEIVLKDGTPVTIWQSSNDPGFKWTTHPGPPTTNPTATTPTTRDASTAAEIDERAACIAAELPAKFAERADVENARIDEWPHRDECRRLVAMLRTATAHSPAPRTVVAEVTTNAENRADLSTWDFVVAEVLEEAVAAHQLPPHAALIDERSPGCHWLTW
ncbi:hypothetical protein [Nocardia salmonicida]|uniref:hypothetical protein n=1 Tax=Nocardia salmonicida TaxID=53431 RepID=UPI0037B0391E